MLNQWCIVAAACCSPIVMNHDDRHYHCQTDRAAVAAKTQRTLASLSSPFRFLPYGMGQAVAALQGKINVDKLDRFTCPHATHTIPQPGRRVVCFVVQLGLTIQGPNLCPL